MEEIIKVCALATCGKEFKTTVKRRKYCSEACRKKAQLISIKASNRRRSKRYTKYCEVCGKLFITTNKNDKTCSKPCYIEYEKYIKTAGINPTAEQFIHKRLTALPTIEQMTAAEAIFYGKTQAQYYPVTVTIPAGLKKAKERQK